MIRSKHLIAASLLCACRPPNETNETSTCTSVAALSWASPDAGALDWESRAWPLSVKTRAQLSSLGMFGAPTWNNFTHEGRELAVATETSPTDNESYIDVHGYVRNRHFDEWRRFFAVKIRGAGMVNVQMSESLGTLSVVGAANKPQFTFDLRAVMGDFHFNL